MSIDYNHKTCELLEIELPASKSISNRALIVQQLCKEKIVLSGLSDADDTLVLQQNLRNKSLKKNIGMAGTAARFLSAFLATQSSTYILTGDERMQQRPMSQLLEALQALGAQIEYLDQEGFLPISINGSSCKGGTVNIDPSISSQFTSALLMIAPSLEGGLTINYSSAPSSRSYVDMTVKLMEYFGIKIERTINSFYVGKQDYKPASLAIESDWSAASYFYSTLALLDEGSFILKNLAHNSWQGDSQVAEIYYRLGIKTSVLENDILLEKSENIIHYLEYNFLDCPDLFQTVVCTCIGLGVEGQFTGLHTLRHKETDRIQALQEEISKFNFQLREEDDVFYLERNRDSKSSNKVATYNDHRMAMAFAPLTVVFGPLEIENPAVVSKSFPRFWEELSKTGIA